MMFKNLRKLFGYGPAPTVEFNRQVLRNQQAIGRLGYAYAVENRFFSTEKEAAELVAARKITEKSYTIAMNPETSYVFNPNSCKATMDDYLQLQTAVIFELANNLPKEKLPKGFNVDAFDPEKVVIGKFKQSKKITNYELSELLAQIGKEVTEAKKDKAWIIATVASNTHSLADNAL